MTLSTMSFIVTGRVIDRVVHIRVTMVPTHTTKDERGLVVTYNIRTKFLNPIIYWFMVKVLKYKDA